VDASNAVDWYLTDRLGSVRDIASNAGQVLDHLDYTPFGVKAAETNPSQTGQLTFDGMRFQVTVGLFDDEARWYDPALRRFLEQDPLLLGPDSNPYRPVNNAPTDGTDPSGQYLVAENGKVTYLGVEQPGGFEVSKAEALEHLRTQFAGHPELRVARHLDPGFLGHPDPVWPRLLRSTMVTRSSGPTPESTLPARADSTRPASMVLPRPTSSAMSRLTRGIWMARTTGSSW